MDESLGRQSPQRSLGANASIALIAVVIVMVGIGGGVLAKRTWSLVHHDPSASIEMPTNAAIEDRWGVRITQVGVTAEGGLVDLRFLVLDPSKAQGMMTDVNNVPVLIRESDGAVINSAALMTGHQDPLPGVTYFFLYRNTQGAIQRGQPVTVSFGDLRLEHVIVR